MQFKKKLIRTKDYTLYTADAEDLPISQDCLSCNDDDPIYTEDDDADDKDFCPDSEEIKNDSSEAWSEAWSDMSLKVRLYIKILT